jgi:transcriptional regulator with XRE-family HTH domain
VEQTPEGREWFTTVVLDLTRRQGMTLNQVAQLAGISEPTFRNARNKHDLPITDKTLRGLEYAYKLGHMELTKVLDSPGYQPQPANQPLNPDQWTSDDVARLLTEFVERRPEEARKLRARIDVVWTKIPSEQ